MKSKFYLEKWNNSCEPKFDDISFGQFKRLSIKPQIALIVVNDIEKKAVLSSLKSCPSTKKKYKVVSKGQTYYIGRFGAFISVVVQSGMGIDGPTDATLTVHDTINNWEIRVVVAVGVAMGLKEEKTHLGDVLVAETIQNYNKIKITSKNKIDRGPKPKSSSILCDRFKNHNDWRYYDEQDRKCNVHVGLMITGGALVNNSQFVSELIKEYPDAIGNEMEASGVWAASERKNVQWIVVKGICDWGKEKKDDYQPLAASAAVSLCKYVFSSQTALDGIVKRKKRITSLSNTNVKINSLKLYYFRSDKGITTRQLASMTNIPEIRIKELESFNTSLKFDHSEFPICTMKEIRAIDNNVCDGRHILTVDNTSKDYMGYLLTYYFKKKLQQTYAKIKAVVFDFDGTLTECHDKQSTWQKIWLKLGYTVKDCNDLHEKFSLHDFNHQTWCDITCDRFKEKMMTNMVLSEVADEMQLVEGAIPTLKKLQKNGVHLFIASGSIRDVIIRVIGENNVYLFEEICANRMEFDHDGCLKKIIGTEYDFDGKHEFVERIAKSLNINPCSVLFVGNSNNDQLAYKSGAVTLCVNPVLTNPHDIKAWNNTIYDMQNLNEILPYLGLS